jgi:hypothetical protein
MEPEDKVYFEFINDDGEIECLEMDAADYKAMCEMEEEENRKQKERREERRRIEDNDWMWADD